MFLYTVCNTVSSNSVHLFIPLDFRTEYTVLLISIIGCILLTSDWWATNSKQNKKYELYLVHDLYIIHWRSSHYRCSEMKLHLYFLKNLHALLHQRKKAIMFKFDTIAEAVVTVLFLKLSSMVIHWLSWKNWGKDMPVKSICWLKVDSWEAQFYIWAETLPSLCLGIQPAWSKWGWPITVFVHWHYCLIVFSSQF